MYFFFFVETGSKTASFYNFPIFKNFFKKEYFLNKCLLSGSTRTRTNSLEFTEVDARVRGSDLLAVYEFGLLHPLVALCQGDRPAIALRVAELAKGFELRLKGPGAPGCHPNVDVETISVLMSKSTPQ